MTWLDRDSDVEAWIVETGGWNGHTGPDVGVVARSVLEDLVEAARFDLYWRQWDPHELAALAALVEQDGPGRRRTLSELWEQGNRPDRPGEPRPSSTGYGVDHDELGERLAALTRVEDYLLQAAIRQHTARMAAHSVEGWATVGITATPLPHYSHDLISLAGPEPFSDQINAAIDAISVDADRLDDDRSMAGTPSTTTAWTSHPIPGRPCPRGECSGRLLKIASGASSSASSSRLRLTTTTHGVRLMIRGIVQTSGSKATAAAAALTVAAVLLLVPAASAQDREPPPETTVTEPPTTLAATTAPTTAPPTSPATVATTAAPRAATPTTAQPKATPAPTTAAPTTTAPAPTTAAPTTARPTTMRSTTAAPTTVDDPITSSTAPPTPEQSETGTGEDTGVPWVPIGLAVGAAGVIGGAVLWQQRSNSHTTTKSNTKIVISSAAPAAGTGPVSHGNSVGPEDQDSDIEDDGIGTGGGVLQRSNSHTTTKSNTKIVISGVATAGNGSGSNNGDEGRPQAEEDDDDKRRPRGIIVGGED